MGDKRVDKEKVQNRFKEIRIRNHLTQKQMAERLGVQKSVVCYYEHGERFPSYDVLLRIASIFHVSTDYLLGRDNFRVLDVSGLSEDEINAVQGVIDVVRQKDK